MGADGSAGLVDAIGVAGLEQAQQDVASGSPVTVNDIVALAGGGSELAGGTRDGHSVHQKLVLDLTGGGFCAVAVVRSAGLCVEHGLLFEDQSGPRSTPQVVGQGAHITGSGELDQAAKRRCDKECAGRIEGRGDCVEIKLINAM